MSENIRISNISSRKAVIDIEGIIGTPENIQFEDPGERVATYEKFSDILERIRGLKVTKVIVNIRSAGGDVNDALLIHDALCSLRAQVTTRCYGYVASAATIVAQAASEGRREISANALYLIHNSVSRGEGNSQALGQTADLLRKTDQRLASIYASRSGRTQDEFLALMEQNGGNGRWLSPEEALGYGLVDRIRGAEAITSMAVEQVRNLRLPEIPEVAGRTPITVNISRKWKGILAALGLKHEEEVEVSESLFELLDDKLSGQAGRVELPGDTPATAHPQALAPETEARNDKRQAKATATIMKEDPVAADIKPSSNRTAYEEDVRNFK